METTPDTTNVVYMDEYRRARWLAELKRAREIGGVAIFNREYPQPAEIVQFPAQEDLPDGAA